MVAQIPQWPVVHSDETSWWVNGPDWLWAFTCPTATVYQVAGSRGRAVIQTMLGENFKGVLVSDCLGTNASETEGKAACNQTEHLNGIPGQKGGYPCSNEDEW